MIAGIKSEFRKLLSIRSTYILLGLSLLYMIFYDFYVIGFKGGVNSGVMAGPSSPSFLMQEVARASGIAAPVLFLALIAVLFMAHEYRYNTIMYTLTASNSRSKTLLAKIIAITGFAIVFSILLEVLAPSLALLGLHAHHIKLAKQVFEYRQFFWRVLFYGWSYAMIGVLLPLFLRNVVASVAALILLPLTIEPLIGLLLNMNQQQYLPFTALAAVLNNGVLRTGPHVISAERSALVALVYIVIGWAVGWLLFLRRDAN
jgi:ABC-2 type transport system permease protein